MPPARKMVGERFGRLVVLSRAPNRKKATYWKCRCDCGTEKEVARSALTSGSTSSCGCLSREKARERGQKKVKNILGNVYGRLTVVELVEGVRRGRQRVWRCRCECGNEIQTTGSLLRNGHSRSCGCLRKELSVQRGRERALPPGKAAMNQLWSRYRRGSRSRKLGFSLERAFFEKLVLSDCHYCGVEPRQVMKDKYGRNGGLVYNGIDRVDPSKGYETDNVVACCHPCNRAKSDFAVDEFFAWAKRVAANAP